MATITERYVQALFSSSRNNEESIMFQKGLQDISENFVSNEEFKNLLLNPRILNREKINIMKELFPKCFKNSIFSNFLSELLKKGRISLIGNISEEYTKMNNSLNEELDIKIVVAQRIDENQIEEIVNKYKELYDVSKVNYDIELDKSVIGGVKVIVGNTIYDNTINTQLKQIIK